MKYLKKWNIFESSQDEILDIFEDIEDICLELHDNEFTTEIRQVKYWGGTDENNEDSDCIMIRISDKLKRFFTLEDIEEVVFRIKEYLSDKNFLIDVGIPGEDVYLPIEFFWKEFSGDELYNVNIYIYYKQRIK